MKNFKVQELVPEYVYNIRGERSIQLMDDRILLFLDKLRDTLGKRITCNDWLWGGKHHYRGLRTKKSKFFSQYSQHTFGRGLDFTVEGMTAEEVRQWIIAHRHLNWIKCITFIESGKEVTWVHVDCRGGTDSDLWVWDKDTNETTVYRR